MKQPDRYTFSVAIVWAVLFTSVAHAQGPLIAFLSDFGLENEAVSLCKARMLEIAPDARLIDITHNVPPFDVWEGSVILRETTSFPSGTVFVAVIDPGVGSHRSAVAARSARGQVYVVPDNGLLTGVASADTLVEVVALDPQRINPKWRPGTFDGRDLFTPAAALIAKAGGEFGAMGEPMEPADIVRLHVPPVNVTTGQVSAYIEREDKPFGNALTPVTASHLKEAGIARGDRLVLELKSGRLDLPLVTAFSDVPPGSPLAYLDSRGHLAFALNMGNFFLAQSARVRDTFTIRKIDADR